MQAIARLRLLKGLVKAEILPAAAIHTVEAAALRTVYGNGAKWQTLRVNAARYVASCPAPAVDQPAWLHTHQANQGAYAAPPYLDECAKSFPAYLNLPSKKPSHLTYIVKKCKELAVTSINRGLSNTAAEDFFSSIRALLGRHQHLHQNIFYAACASAAVQVAETAQARGVWCWDQASELVEALCHKIGPDWAKLNAYTAVNLLQVLAKCQLQHDYMSPAHLNAAAEQVFACCEDLNQQGVSLAAWSCASLYQRHNPTQNYGLLGRLEDQALKWEAGEIKLQHAATITWSMARSQYLPSPGLLGLLTEAACLQVVHSVAHTAQDIEMLFLGYAWLGWAPSPHALQTLTGQFLDQQLQSHQASNMAWALAVLGQLNMPLFLDLLAQVRTAHLEEVKVSRQLHVALEFLRPETDLGPEFQQWQSLSEQLHTSWPYQPMDKRTRALHEQVLDVLQDGLQLRCHKDVPMLREHDHDLFSVDILIEEQPGVPYEIAVEVDGPDCYIHNDLNHSRALGPTTFRNSMILRHVPCLISIPYYEWVDKGAHLAHVYIQDKLRIEGNCDLPDFVLPE